MSGKLLIVDDVATNRLVMKVKLAAARYEVLVAESGAQARKICIQEQPDLVLMDVMMPDADGVALCRDLKRDPLTQDIPIILFTALNDAEARLSGLQAGADDFLAKPIDEVALLARVRSLLRTRDQARELQLREATCAEFGFHEPPQAFAPRAEITLIAPTLEQSRLWQTQLSAHVRDRMILADRDSALHQPKGDKASDLFLIAIDLDSPNEGLRLMSDLRSRAATRHSAIMVLLPKSDSERAATALDLGAADICYEPFEPGEIAVRIQAQLARKRRADRLRDTWTDGLRLAMVDPLTGLYNRRYGMRHLNNVAHRSQVLGQSASVIMLDIDHFKAINDQHGHLNGDRVLTQVADQMREGVRSQDLVCRIGGEEFLVVLPDTSVAQARAVAERLLHSIADLRTQSDSGAPLRVTLSLGLGDLRKWDYDVERTLQAVDRALYAAKANGRNTLSIAEMAS